MTCLRVALPPSALRRRPTATSKAIFLGAAGPRPMHVLLKEPQHFGPALGLPGLGIGDLRAVLHREPGRAARSRAPGPRRRSCPSAGPRRRPRACTVLRRQATPRTTVARGRVPRSVAIIASPFLPFCGQPGITDRHSRWTCTMGCNCATYEGGWGRAQRAPGWPSTGGSSLVPRDSTPATHHATI